MIGPTGAVRVLVATQAGGLPQGRGGAGGAGARDDGRRSVLAARSTSSAPSAADRIKLIFWDGTGVCLFAKRLEEGEFRWPKVEDGVMRLTAAQLSALLEGLDWRRVHEMRRDPRSG